MLFRDDGKDLNEQQSNIYQQAYNVVKSLWIEVDGNKSLVVVCKLRHIESTTTS